MKELFHSLQELSFKRLGKVVACVMVFWYGIEKLMPEWLFHKGIILLAALTATLTFAMKPMKRKGLKTRKTDPPGGENVATKSE